MERQPQRKDPFAEKRPSSNRMRGVMLAFRLLMLLIVVVGCGTAVFVLYGRWIGTGSAQVAIAGGDPALPQVERFYLQTYLGNQAEALEAPVGTGAQPIQFTIASGETPDVIAANLQRTGLLNDPELFSNYLRYTGQDSQLEAGTFTLNPQMTLPELVTTLTNAVAQEVTIRFVEGWRLEEMADHLRVESPATVDADEFLRIVQRQQPFDLSGYDFLASLPPTSSLEGFLFPDTYRLPVDADAAFLVDLMLQTFGRRVTPTMRQAYGAQGLTVQQAVTLASIVEREAVVAAERPLIAGVFFNRLAQGIQLEADPTVQYPLGYQPAQGSWWKNPLTVADLQAINGYNTYVIDGLPAGPIANPGLSSLEAVARPTDSQFIFFVADCQAATPGSHLFSITYEEHLAKVNQCR